MLIVASGPTIKTRLKAWKIRRTNPERENEALARCLLHARAAGRQISFTRFGQPYPLDKVEKYLARNRLTEPSGDVLPAYFKAVEGTLARTDAVTEIPEGTLEAPGQPSQARASSHESQTVGEPPRKKRKHDSLDTPPRTNGHGRASPARSREYEQAKSANENDAKDEAPEDAESAQAKLENMQKAVASVKALGHDLGLKDADIAEALNEPDKIPTLAKERKAQKQEDDKQTDLGPLHWASFRNDVDVINALLKHGADVNARGGSGYTALHVAANQDNFLAMKALLVDGLDLDVIDDEGRTPLVHAINGESLQCALMLVHQGADVDICSAKGRSPLHYVCQEKDMKPLLEQILPRSKDVNKKDNEDHTPLHMAIFSKNWEYVETLIKHGTSDLNVQDLHGRTPMHAACFQAPPNILKMMLETAQVDCTITAKEQETVLHLLCQRDICDVAEICVRKPGVDVNAKRIDGTTSLILAAYNGSYDTVEMLIKNRANVADRDADLDTALTTAIRAGYTKVAELLIENNSPVNPQNNSRKRYRAELQSKRKAQEVSSVLKSMGNNSRPPLTRSDVRPQRGPSLVDAGRPSSLSISGLPAFSSQQLQNVFGQLLDQTIVQLSRANNGPGSPSGSAPSNITMDTMQNNMNANMAYGQGPDMNMFGWDSVNDIHAVNDMWPPGMWMPS